MNSFVDWMFFLAIANMPNENYVSEDDISLINNVIKYSRRVRYGQYILSNDVSKIGTVPGKNNDGVTPNGGGRTLKRKHEGNPCV